jgi:hypothetical protein
MNYHDWEIVGIKFDKNSRSLELNLAFRDEKFLVFKAHDCLYFRVTDYIWQNVIHDFSEVSPKTGASELIKILKWLTLEETRSEGEHSNEVAELMDSIITRNLKLVQFNPSFGADIALLCKDYFFE